MRDIQTFPDADGVARAAAEQFKTLADEAIKASGRFSVALSGGSTPERLFQLLATAEFADVIDWSNVHIFWGDERTVPPKHEESNYRMAKAALLDHVPLPKRNIRRIRGEIAPLEEAVRYERKVRAFFGALPFPRFDLIYLGMGEDGHTASLFPYTEVLDEELFWYAENFVEKFDTWRITITPPAINAAANVTLLVAGAGKAARLAEVLHGPHDPKRLPVQLVHPEDGRLLWLVDEAAAAML